MVGPCCLIRLVLQTVVLLVLVVFTMATGSISVTGKENIFQPWPGWVLTPAACVRIRHSTIKAGLYCKCGIDLIRYISIGKLIDQQQVTSISTKKYLEVFLAVCRWFHA